MNVQRKERWQRLGDLGPGQRFRFEGEGPEYPAWIAGVTRKNERNCTSSRDGSNLYVSSQRLVEHIPGHWQPEDEEEGLVAIGDVDIFAVVDFDGEWWVHTNEGADSDCRCLRMLGKPSSCRYIRQERLVRVVHGTFVEGYKETES